MVLITILSAVALSHTVSAIGVSPGRTTIDFEPGLEREITFTILNNEHKDMDVVLYVNQGEQSDWLTLYDGIVSFRSDEESRDFTYLVRLPDSVDDPGNHKIEIVAREIPKSSEGSGTSVGATTAVVTQCIVRVPYPGKYVQLGLEVPQTDDSEDVRLFVKAQNLGAEDIEEAYAVVEIYGPTNELIDVLETENVGIAARRWHEFKVVWDADINPGIYNAVVMLRYDEGSGGGVARVEKNFAVSNLFIDVREITVRNFRLGGVAKFNIMIESKWNQKVENVYGDLVITDESDNKIADVRTASVDMEPLSMEELNAYWETDDVKVGDYTGNFVLHYAGKETFREIETHIGVDDIRVDILDLGIGAVISEPSGSEAISMDTIIMAMFLILMVINIGWFAYFRKRR